MDNSDLPPEYTGICPEPGVEDEKKKENDVITKESQIKSNKTLDPMIYIPPAHPHAHNTDLWCCYCLSCNDCNCPADENCCDCDCCGDNCCECGDCGDCDCGGCDCNC